jgi:predicted dehydrogenase
VSSSTTTRAISIADRAAGRTTEDSGSRRAERPRHTPRIGFAGVGWIGRARLDALADTGLVEVAAVADPDQEARMEAAAQTPGVARVGAFEELLAEDLDGLVIATPSALHAEQATTALERGVAVFCQKPLGRTAAETRQVVETARRRDLPLGVDFCYRHVRAAEAVRDQVAAGALGDVYAADVTFHNAYGPDKAWFYDLERAGGGCLIDLGIHLVDLARWTLGFPAVEGTTARLYAGGRPWRGEGVEDYAEARLDLAGGVSARIACSWNLPADRDAIIEATFYGTEAAARMRNVDGSFYDFVAERLEDGHAVTLAEPPDDWGGRAIAAWAAALADGESFDPAVAEAVAVAETLDRIYGRAP